MPTIPVGFGQMQFRYALTGDPQEMLTTLGFAALDAGANDAADIAAAAAVMETSWRTNVIQSAAAMFTGWRYNGATYQGNGADTGPFDGVIPASIAGTGPGETAAVNTTILIQKRSNIAGRANRGRMYVPMAQVEESNISKLGVINGVIVEALQLQVNDFLDDLAAGTPATLAYILHSDLLVSEGPPPVYEPNPAPPAVVSQLVVQSIVATQRRRLRP